MRTPLPTGREYTPVEEEDSVVLSAIQESAAIIEIAGGVDNVSLDTVLKPILKAGKKRAKELDEALADIGYSGGGGKTGHPGRGSGARKILIKAFPAALTEDALIDLFNEAKNAKRHDKAQRRKYIEAELEELPVDEGWQLIWDVYDAMWLAEQNNVDVEGLTTVSSVGGITAAAAASIIPPPVGPIVGAIIGAVAALFAVLATAANQAGARAAETAQMITEDLDVRVRAEEFGRSRSPIKGGKMRRPTRRSSAPVEEDSEAMEVLSESFEVPTLQTLIDSIPTPSLRSRGESWLAPDEFTTSEITTAWASAKKKAALVPITPAKYQTAVEALMIAVAQINSLLLVAPDSAAKTALANDLHQVASGLYGLASFEDGSSVSGYDPVDIGTFEGQTLAVYVFTVEGIRIDATAASFAKNILGFALLMKSQAQTLVEENLRTSSTSYQVSQVVKENVGIGTVGVVAAVAGLGLFLLGLKKK